MTGDNERDTKLREWRCCLLMMTWSVAHREIRTSGPCKCSPVEDWGLIE